MIVDFYMIKGCEYELYQGRHVIFAPAATEENLLYTYRFFRTDDGRACHFLTQDEYYHVMNNMSSGRAVFGSGSFIPIQSGFGEPIPPQEKDVNTLCYISLILLLCSFFVTPIVREPGFSTLFFITSFVLAIVARCKNSKSTFALVLVIVHCVLLALAVIGIIMLLIACGKIIDSCSEQCAIITAVRLSSL